MAYRDARDPRIAQLEQLIVSEPELRQRRSQLRREHDALQERADTLGIACATAQRQLALRQRVGVMATLRRWFSAAPAPHAAAVLQRDLASVEARLAELAAEERALDQRLAEIANAGDQLGALVAERAAALRTAEGGLGDELRALDAAGDDAHRTLAALDLALRACERAQVVSAELLEIQRTARATGSPAYAAAAIVSTAAAIVSDGAFEWAGSADRGTLEARSASQLEVVRERLVALVRDLDALEPRFAGWPGREPGLQLAQLRSLAVAPLLEPAAASLLARQAAGLATCLDGVLTQLNTARVAAERRIAELGARQRELVELAPP